MSPASSYNSPAGGAGFIRCISASHDRETDARTLYFHWRVPRFPPFVNPPSTLNNVGLHAHPQHSPCPCYTHVLSRCWHVGTIRLFAEPWVGATAHRPIVPLGGANWALAVPFVLSEDTAPMIVPMPTRGCTEYELFHWGSLL